MDPFQWVMVGTVVAVFAIGAVFWMSGLFDLDHDHRSTVPLADPRLQVDWDNSWWPEDRHDGSSGSA